MYRLIDIIKLISPQVIVIDQFNYFGRRMYELTQ
jgi:hypothetical protein